MTVAEQRLVGIYFPRTDAEEDASLAQGNVWNDLPNGHDADINSDRISFSTDPYGYAKTYSDISFSLKNVYRKN